MKVNRDALVQAHERHDLILKRLEEQSSITVSGLAQELNVSEMTVRRDLELLEASGSLTRVHGGAVPSQSRSYEPPFASRSVRSVEAKQRIGRAAANLVRDGETLILDAGTTTLEIARALHGRRNLRVMALSLHIAAELVDEPALNVLLPGGVCRPGERSFIGSTAEQVLRGFSFDTLFLTVGGVSAASGITEYNLDDAAVKRAAFANSRRRIAVTDSSKLGKIAFARICALEELDMLITDNSAPAALVAEFRRLGLEVLLV
jgi:DeoR/GlpR family transcriptional regulator of sugar metabolism